MYRHLLALCLLLLGAASAYGQLVEFGDHELSEITGQALVLSDRNVDAANNLTFYRVAIDAELGMNMNIDRMQLGCGGYNEIVASGCDQDFQYVRLMGRGAGQPGAADAAPAPSGSSILGGGTDFDNNVFKMTRPYLEFAIKNDGSYDREFVGMKLGAQYTDGYMGIGRYITPGSAPGCTTPSDLACHTGVDSLSGYLKARMVGELYGCIQGLCWLGDNIRLGTFDTVLGLSGTRMQTLTAMNIPVNLLGISGVTLKVNLIESPRYLHGFSVNPGLAGYTADDFFLSFQRERVRWPTFNKTSAYSNPANPGWWINVPAAELLGLVGRDNVVPASGLFGLTIANMDVGQRPPDNCYGALVFC